MNWKPNLSRCLVMSFGLALTGCGSAADTATTTSQQSSESPALTDATLVTLHLPGMT